MPEAQCTVKHTIRNSPDNLLIVLCLWQSRGVIEVKGKGKMTTFWVTDGREELDISGMLHVNVKGFDSMREKFKI